MTEGLQMQEDAVLRSVRLIIKFVFIFISQEKLDLLLF